MRLVLCVLVAGFGLVAGVAAARAIDLPPPPTVPTPTVPTVTLPVPVPPVTTPPLPKPPPPPPPPPPVSSVTNQTQTSASSVTQTATNAARTATGASSSGSTAGGASGGTGSGGSSGGSAASSGSTGSESASGSRSSMRVDHFQSSRGWIGTTGPKKRRTTTLTFTLPHAGRVILTVNQVSPQCLGVGHFTVQARSGLNRVRFSGRVHGQQLGPGTYRISIRTTSGHVVRRVTLVVVDGPAPSSEELRSMRAANTCPARAEQASLISSASGSAAAAPAAMSGSGGPPASSGASASGFGVATPTGPNVHSGVLGSSIQETARALQPLLIALLALSILLLTVASLPRYAVADPRMHDLLARHRVEIAGLGAAALVAVAIAFFVG